MYGPGPGLHSKQPMSLPSQQGMSSGLPRTSRYFGTTDGSYRGTFSGPESRSRSVLLVLDARYFPYSVLLVLFSRAVLNNLTGHSPNIFTLQNLRTSLTKDEYLLVQSVTRRTTDPGDPGTNPTLSKVAPFYPPDVTLLNI